MQKNKKKKTWLIIIVIVMSIIVLSLKSNKKDNSILSVQVLKGKFEVSFTVTGELESKNKEFINAPIEIINSAMGYIQTKIQDIVPEGTVVDSGDYVASLDQSTLVNQLKDIEIEKNKQEALLSKTKLDTLLSMRELRNSLKEKKYNIEEKKIIVEQSIYEPPATQRQVKMNYEKSIDEYEQFQSNFKIKQMQLQASISDVQSILSQINIRKQNIQEMIEKFTIRAKKSGMVIYNRDRMGRVMGIGTEIAQWNMTVATLPDMTKMTSKTYVNEIDINKVKKGQTVIVKLDASSAKGIKGVVSSVANVGTQLPNSDAKVFEVMIDIVNVNPVMKPSMTTSNTIVCEHYSNVLYLPIDAVHSNDSISYVFTVDGKRKIVELGASNENFVIIKKGLSEHQKVLLSVPEDIENYPFQRN